MLKKIGNAIGWIFMVLCIFILAVAALSFYNSRKTGEPTTIFGYRPVYILTGSMEPYMREHSIVITKELTSKDKIKVGDVITFHVKDSDGENLVVTHRIHEANSDGTYTTKGDNNNVTDAIPVSRENMEARVIFVMNWVASFVALWATAKGKFIVFAIIGTIILVIVALKVFFGKDDEEEPEEKAAPSSADVQKVLEQNAALLSELKAMKEKQTNADSAETAATPEAETAKPEAEPEAVKTDTTEQAEAEPEAIPDSPAADGPETKN